MSYSRFAIYYLPSSGTLATFGKAWLGWDIERGCATPQFNLPGLSDITMTPRKYGFHATLKPPFRLADGVSIEDLIGAISKLATVLPPASSTGLTPTSMGSFLALTPVGDTSKLQELAANCVCKLDKFRAPSTGDELMRRLQAGLTARQEAFLRQWGYPYVLEEFRFHLTLSGQLPEDSLPLWHAHVDSHLPELPRTFIIEQIALCGEREDGKFECLRHFQLSG